MSGHLPAASFDERVEALFRPPLAEMITLSPDGQRVAYTRKTGRDVAIVIMHLDYTGPRKTIRVNPDRDVAATEERPPVQLRFLRWATDTRLVFAPTERIEPLPPVTDAAGRTVPNPDGPTIISPIVAVNSDGKQRGVLADARDFTESSAEARSLADLLRTPKELQATRNEPVHWRMPRLEILGFLPADRQQLVIGTRGGFNFPAQYLIDIRTASVRAFGGDWPSPPSEQQVFDWFRLKVVGERKDAARPMTAWKDEELGQIQRDLELKFPKRIVEILDWNETRARVLFRVTGGSDPGRLFVYQRTEDLVLEILRRAPWLTAAKLNDTRYFEFAAPDGAQLTGYVTWPGKPRHASPPLLVIFPAGFPGRCQPAFDPESQVFADMGFVVARLNHRGVAGVRAEDLNSLRTAVDRVSVDDARAAIEWIAAQNPSRPFDRQRVATFGRGFGGYLAVRALQLEPMAFRCGIGLDAPMDLRPWLRPQEAGIVVSPAKAVRDIPAPLIDHAGAEWKNLSVVDQADSLTNPVLLLLERNRNAAVDVSTDTLRARLQSLGRLAELHELDSGFNAANSKSRASVYRKIEEFFNLHLQHYAVTMGPAKEVK